MLEEANLKLKPLRDKNVEILSKLQRLNLEFENLEDEERRAKTDKERIQKAKETIEVDIEREKNIILDAQSNERRLSEEKNILIDTEKKYYDLEKQTEQDLQHATSELKTEQEKLERISKSLSLNNQDKEFVKYLNNINQELQSTKLTLENDDKEKAMIALKNSISSVEEEAKK